MNAKNHRTLTLVCLILGVLAPVADAFARRRGPDVPRIEETPPWLAIAVAFVGAAVICVLGFKGSGRTHLD